MFLIFSDKYCHRSAPFRGSSLTVLSSLLSERAPEASTGMASRGQASKLWDSSSPLALVSSAIHWTPHLRELLFCFVPGKRAHLFKGMGTQSSSVPNRTADSHVSNKKSLLSRWSHSMQSTKQPLSTLTSAQLFPSFLPVLLGTPAFSLPAPSVLFFSLGTVCHVSNKTITVNLGTNTDSIQWNTMSLGTYHPRPAVGPTLLSSPGVKGASRYLTMKLSRAKRVHAEPSRVFPKRPQLT